MSDERIGIVPIPSRNNVVYDSRQEHRRQCLRVFAASGELSDTLAVVVSFIAWYTARQKLKQDVIPTLVFYRKTPTPGEKWIVKNVGLGPALNVQIEEADLKGEWLDLNFPCPIAAKDCLPLDGLKVADQLRATYTDMWGTRYCTICADNINRFSKISCWLRELLSPNALEEKLQVRRRNPTS